MRRLTHRLPTAAPLLGWLAAAVLAGCTAPPPVPTAAMQPMPAAERIDRAHPVRFSPTLATLSSDEAMRLQAFLDRLPLGPASDLRVIAQARDARRLTLATRRAEAVAAAIRAAGFDRARVVPPVLGRTVPAGAGRDGFGQGEAVEVVATTYAVRLPDCPDWSRDPAFDARNLPLANLGCATAVNLGLMIADPADLVRGRGLGPADGEREAEAIERYRTDKIREPEKDVMVP